MLTQEPQCNNQSKQENIDMRFHHVVASGVCVCARAFLNKMGKKVPTPIAEVA